MSYVLRSHDEVVRDLLQGPPARGNGTAWFAALTRRLGEVDAEIYEIYRGLIDVQDAAGPVLDLHGERLREPRAGLDDAEYRRILAGRRIARHGGTVGRIWAGWCALTGTTDGIFEELPPSSIYLEARIGWEPSRRYLARAGAVVRRLTLGGVETNAILTRQGTALFDSQPGFDDGNFAYTLNTTGA